LKLPSEVNKQVKDAYSSIRISKDYRAVGVIAEQDILWFWIGSHSEYDKLLKHLNQ